MEKFLDLQKLYVQETIPSREFLSGLLDVNPSIIWDTAAENIKLKLEAYVLSEKAGPVQQKTVVHEAYYRPKWFPKWLWKKIPFKTMTYTLEVTPTYIYPNASIQIPDLKSPVRIPIVNYAYWLTEDASELPKTGN